MSHQYTIDIYISLKLWKLSTTFRNNVCLFSLLIYSIVWPDNYWIVTNLSISPNCTFNMRVGTILADSVQS